MPTTIIDAIEDKALFAPWFKDRSTWSAWLVVLKALFALSMTPDELAIFQQLTGRNTPPGKQPQEAFFVVGRRGGKSFIVALIAVFLACFRDYKKYLNPGEVGVVMIIAADRKQARVIFRYVKALLENVAMLKPMIVRADRECIELSNGLNIEIHTCSFRSTRGYTNVAVLGDELAFWRSEDSAIPDHEVLNALKPSMLTIPNSMLIGLGSPYRRRGVLYDAHRNYYGQDVDDVLVVQADSRTMNPTLPQSFIDREYARDPAAAAAEYFAQFRNDIAGFLQNEWIDAVVAHGQYELPPQRNIKYFAFCDPSGGGADAFTLSIAHKEHNVMVLDVLRGHKFAQPQATVAEFAAILRDYHCTSVMGDRYSGAWVVDAFRAHGITYKQSPRAKSELYLEAEPLFAQGAVQLLDNRTMLNEMRNLERRTHRSGRDTVDHPPGAHDDYANAACGALLLASEQARNAVKVYSLYTGRPINPDGPFTDSKGRPVSSL